jgi:hypothetical protein
LDWNSARISVAIAARCAPRMKTAIFAAARHRTGFVHLPFILEIANATCGENSRLAETQFA